MRIAALRHKGSTCLLTDAAGVQRELSGEIAMKHCLREGMEFSDDAFAELLAESDARRCFEAATRLLETRQHSRSELGVKLAQRKFDRRVVAATLAELERLGLVDDRIFAEAYASELAGKGQGNWKIKQALHKKGLEQELVAETVATLTVDSDEDSRMEDLLRRKLAALGRSKDPPEKIREKLVRHLATKGFPAGMVYRKVAQFIAGGQDGEDFPEP